MAPGKQRVYIIEKTVLNKKVNLVSFTFSRKSKEDNEKFKIFYGREVDKFYQLQESSNGPRMMDSKCCSMFAGDTVLKSTLVYLITEFDPLFFMVPIFAEIEG